jgi:hypothetical protein
MALTPKPGADHGVTWLVHAPTKTPAAAAMASIISLVMSVFACNVACSAGPQDTASKPPPESEIDLPNKLKQFPSGESNMTRKLVGSYTLLVATVSLLLGASGGEPLGDEGEGRGSKQPGSAHGPRTVEVGTQLTSVTISRIQRTPTDLAGRAATLAGAIIGTTCSPSQATDWAQDASSKRGTVTIAKPFSCSPDIEVSYLGYYDRLIVKDLRSNPPPPSQLVQSPTDPRPAVGIGKRSARAVASPFVTEQLIPTGLVDDTWLMADSRRLIDGMVDIAGGTSGSKVREYGFGYRRHVEGFPLIDSLLEVSVDSTGVVRRIVLADVRTTTGEQVAATRSESTAKALFQQLAEARADGWSPDIDATVKRFRVGYVLPYDEESTSTLPVLWGEILHKHGVIVSPEEDATLSFVSSNPSLRVLVPWTGESTR